MDFLELMKALEDFKLKRKSKFYRHCKISRATGEHRCEDCPFREIIEKYEELWDQEEKTTKRS
jgi:hypothetical protein